MTKLHVPEHVIRQELNAIKTAIHFYAEGDALGQIGELAAAYGMPIAGQLFTAAQDNLQQASEIANSLPRGGALASAAYDVVQENFVLGGAQTDGPNGTLVNALATVLHMRHVPLLSTVIPIGNGAVFTEYAEDTYPATYKLPWLQGLLNEDWNSPLIQAASGLNTGYLQAQQWHAAGVPPTQIVTTLINEAQSWF